MTENKGVPGVKADPVTLEVMRNGLYSIADEMTAALVRTGYSTNIKDRRDCSCAIYDLNGDAVAQSELNTPVHLGTMHPTVHTVLDKFPLETLAPGDAIVLNTPYPAGPGHLNDVAIVCPVFWHDQLVALVANQAHHVDMGGYAPGSMPFGVTEIYQEGLQIPPLKLRRAGVIEKGVLELILENVRTKIEVRGDLMAQIAANNVGQMRLCQLVEKHGLATFQTYLQAMMDYSERRLRSGLSQLPEGRYEFEDFLEGDSISDDLIKIKVAVIIAGDEVTFDFEGTDPQVAGPLNCRWPSVAACVFFVIKALVDPELPPNAGAFRPVHIRVPEGSLLSATYPAAVCNANILTAQRLVDVLLGAFLQVIPERVTAASSGTMNLLNIGGLYDDGRYYNYVETYGGGQGAAGRADGMDAVQNGMTNTRNAPIEAVESAYPLLVEAYALVPDSEGAGRYRGGVGLTRRFRILGKQAKITLSTDRMQIGPWGAHGGLPAQGASCTIHSAAGETIRLESKVTRFVERHDRVQVITPGGGGWGSPYERDPEAVRWDVIEGLVSVERARTVYGVVLDPETLKVRAKKTRRLREQGKGN
jgi:N-methylhydantoinase B